MHLHINNKAFLIVFEANAKGYVEFPEIKQPHTFTMYSTTLRKTCTLKKLAPETIPNFSPNDPMGTTPRVHVHKNESTKATKAKQSKQTIEPVIPWIKWKTNSIELNAKTHKLSITKDYMLKDHIRLKEQYKLVQHPPRSVPVVMQSACKVELNRLMKEGIITEVTQSGSTL